ncbi:MAG: FHA domain-containing protein [Pseudomarimonas sp.]
MSFPNGEHPDVLLEDGELTVGGAAGNRVLIPGLGLAGRHASFRVDAQRGILLNVLDAAANVHVNARPVREMSFLRLGDVVSLERLQVLVKPDRDAVIELKVPADSRPLTDPAQRTGASRVVLRGVSGAYSGRSMNLCDPLRIGRGSEVEVRLDDPDLPEHHATLEIYGERVLLRNMGSAEGSVVNGVAVRDAVLHPGDQIAFDGHRFVLEAPGLPPRGSAPAAIVPGMAAGSTQTLQAVRASDASDASSDRSKPAARATPRPAKASNQAAVDESDESDQGSRFSYGWLILVAAAIGAGLAALLVYAPR